MTPGQSLVIGRDADCDLVSTNPTVARRHARVYRDAGGWRLDDLGSSGGTFADGGACATVPLAGSMAVWLGDPETGERVVVATSGQRKLSTAKKFDRAARKRAPLVVAAVAVVAIAGMIVALLAWRGGDGASTATDSLARATVRVVINNGWGSGSVVDAEKGLILTNAHVVDPQAPGQAIGTGQSAAELEKNPDTILIALTTVSTAPPRCASRQRSWRATATSISPS